MESTRQDLGVSPSQRPAIPADAVQAGAKTTDSDLAISNALDSAAPGRGMMHEPRPSMARWIRRSIVSDLVERYGQHAVDRHWLRLEEALDRATTARKVAA